MGHSLLPDFLLLDFGFNNCGSHYFMVSATYVPSLDILEQQTTKTALNTQFELVSNAVLSVQGNPRLRTVKDAKSWLIEC